MRRKSRTTGLILGSCLWHSLNRDLHDEAGSRVAELPRRLRGLGLKRTQRPLRAMLPLELQGAKTANDVCLLLYRSIFECDGWIGAG